ncbi:type VII secretion-associated serine protease mycosin [Actinoplanes sp. NPDC026623]|uniref:type VII secretion-associated serine protease mycosin n=1 Tax=Actinoplanes sp. NPDC026623 TaxID=3155610 RepID=UPI0033FA6626
MTRRLIAVLAAALAGAGAALYGSPASADQYRNQQWHLDYLNVAEAHRISTGKGVTVAVIDSGVSKHPDLAGSVLKGTDFVKPGGDGTIDLDGHGTNMAGLIAAHGKNGNGALGIAPDAKILPIRILGSGHAKVDFAPALQYAISHGAKVVNLSVGGSVTPAIINAIEAAKSSDVVIVAAAGNRPDDVGVAAPAFLDGIVAVGAVDKKGNKAEISVTGPAMDLAAPGEDMTSTSNKGLYSVGTQGTSGAAAIVSGAAALLRSKYPNMSADEVVQRLEATATDKGAPGVDPVYGHGIVNLVAALSATDIPASSGQPSTPATSQDAATPPTSQAAPGASTSSSSTPLLFGGLAVAVLVAGLVAVFALRRKQSPDPR